MMMATSGSSSTRRSMHAHAHTALFSVASRVLPGVKRTGHLRGRGRPASVDDDTITEGGQHAVLQCEDAKALLDTKACMFVDMRSEKAYDLEHITKPPRMTVNIPYQGGDIEEYASLIQHRYSNTTTGMLLVCENGDVGIATAGVLQAKGYAKAYGVEGGYLAWMQKFTTSGRRRIGGKFVSSGKEALKSGLNLDAEVASTYEENWGRPDLSLPSNRAGKDIA